MTQFHFLIEATAAAQLAADMQAFPFRGPVHDRIIAELRKPAQNLRDEGDGFAGPHVLCQIELQDHAVVYLWSVDPRYGQASGRPWADALRRGLEDGCRL